MLEDVRTVVWKESKEMLRAGAGRLRGPRAYFAGMVAVGALLSVQVGAGYAASWRIGYLLVTVAMLAVASVITDSVAGERERHTLESLLATPLSERAIVLGKLLAAIGHGVMVAACVYLGGALATAVRFGSAMAPPDAWRLAVSLLWSVLAAGFAAALGLLISQHSSAVRQAQQRYMLTLMVVLILPFVVGKYLGPAGRARVLARADGASWSTALAAAALLLVVDGGIAMVAMRRFRPALLLAT